MNTEKKLSPTDQVKLILLEASRLGARLHRRNVGQGWIGSRTYRAKGGERVTLAAGDVVIRQARPFHNGETGQSDTYGWRTVIITPEMVGTKMAQHVEIEAKQGSGRETSEQAAWGRAVIEAGGVYGVAREPADVAALLAKP